MNVMLRPVGAPCSIRGGETGDDFCSDEGQQ
jgi:hypothetical protein